MAHGAFKTSFEANGGQCSSHAAGAFDTAVMNRDQTGGQRSVVRVKIMAQHMNLGARPFDGNLNARDETQTVPFSLCTRFG